MRQHCICSYRPCIMNYSEDSAVWHLHCSGRNMRKQNISSAVSRHAAACRQSQFKLYVCCSPAPAQALPTTSTHTVGLGQAHRAWLSQARPAQAVENTPPTDPTAQSDPLLPKQSASNLNRPRQKPCAPGHPRETPAASLKTLSEMLMRV